MTVSLAELNQLAAPEASDLFRAACGASSWVDQMVTNRPYDSVEHLLAAADTAWAASGPDEWHEAFANHPRIGEAHSVARQSELAQGWAEGEQSKARLASSSIFDQMSLVNHAYEGKFGHIFIVSAASKSAGELLELARERLKNDPATELRVAANEQAEITRLRLKKLVGDST